jgi:hypothetical protein
MSYNPPAGVVRHLLAMLFGADPRGEDVVLHAQKADRELDYDDVVSTFKAICEHHHLNAAAAAK